MTMTNTDTTNQRAAAAAVMMKLLKNRKSRTTTASNKLPIKQLSKVGLSHAQRCKLIKRQHPFHRRKAENCSNLHYVIKFICTAVATQVKTTEIRFVVENTLTEKIQYSPQNKTVSISSYLLGLNLNNVHKLIRQLELLAIAISEKKPFLYVCKLQTIPEVYSFINVM